MLELEKKWPTGIFPVDAISHAAPDGGAGTPISLTEYQRYQIYALKGTSPRFGRSAVGRFVGTAQSRATRLSSRPTRGRRPRSAAVFERPQCGSAGGNRRSSVECRAHLPVAAGGIVSAARRNARNYGKADGRGQIKDRISMDQRPGIDASAMDLVISLWSNGAGASAGQSRLQTGCVALLAPYKEPGLPARSLPPR